MPRPRKIEKAKNFKGSIKRLFKELSPFKVLIILGLILAALGSVLSIMAPSRLSDLVDKISEPYRWPRRHPARRNRAFR